MSLITLIRYIPQFLELIQAIQQGIEDAKTNRKVSDDLQAITEAFKNKDSNALNNIFNGLPVKTSDNTDV